MAASLTGLAMGGIILILQNMFLDEETAQRLLTFSNSNFFVWGSLGHMPNHQELSQNKSSLDNNRTPALLYL